MRLPELEGFPGSARVWIFGAERTLDALEAGELLEAVDRFLSQWAAHGVPLRAARALCYRRFLIVGADTRSSFPSGCSIDALVRMLRGMEDRLEVRFLGNEAVWYRDGEKSIRRASRPEFRALARSGEVTAASVVFDNSITQLAELRDGLWEGPAGERWHAAFFERRG